jgi:dTDP-glucose 4,6-dehydratase
MSSKNILVTGGYGFIGGNFIRFLKDNFPQHKITNIDKNGYASNPEYIKGLVDEDYTLDIGRHSGALTELFNDSKQFDYIFHFAAESHVDNSIKDPSEFVYSNVVGTQNLLENFRQRGSGKFIHISTDEVYGHLGINEPSFTEDSPIAPRSPYAASKASSDLLCLSYINTYESNICITRCCNNYGPNQHEEKFIPTIIKSLKEGKKVPVYGEGMNVREWIHVYDHCLGIWAVATQGKKGVYNIGSGYELSNIELVDIICKVMGKDLDESVKFVEDRLGHDFRYSIDSSKIEDELLYEINYPDFEKEIEKVIEYYETTTG